MKLIGTMVAHNEDWIIGLTARAMLMWCDELIVMNHCSTDFTADILEQIYNENPKRVSVIEEANPVFHSIRFYERVVDAALSRRATHIAVLDADEIVSGCLKIKEAANTILPGFYFDVPWIPMADLRRRLISRTTLYTGFVFNVSVSSVVYPRIGELDYDIHLSRLPLHYKPYLYDGDGGLMHLQSWDQRRAKAKAVRWKFMEILRWPGRVSVEWLNEYYDRPVFNESDISELVNETWYKAYQDLADRYVVIGGESPVEREVKELWAKHKDKFAGVNTFGLFD